MCRDISLFFKSNFISLFILVVLCLSCCVRFSLVTENEGHSPDVVCGLLTEWASLVELRLQGAWASVAAAPGLGSCSSWVQKTSSIVAVHGLIFSTTCEIFPEQRLNPCLLHQQMDSSPLSRQESLHLVLFICNSLMAVRLSTFLYAALGRCPDFCPLLIGWFVFFLLSFKSSLCILATSYLSNMCFENTFSQPVAQLFIFLTVSYTEQKFLILMKSNLPIFSFTDCAFGVVSKTHHPV